MRQKQVVCNLISMCFDKRNLGYNKNKLYKYLGYSSRDMLNFNFPEKGMGLVSLSHFVDDFSKKWLSYYILLTDQISLYDYHYISRY